jgi:hypothetical protein
MKTSYFLTFLAIYGLITGGMMLFDGAGALKNYGVQPIDQYHIATIQYLGITNIGLALLTLLLRNSGDTVIRSIFMVTAFDTIFSFLKGCYDVFLLSVPSNNFFWIDMSFRLLVGLVCVYFLFRGRASVEA